MFPPEWKAARKKAISKSPDVPEHRSLTSLQLWTRIFPALFDEVELDLRQHNLIIDLDADLRDRSWHFIRTAILRLVNIDGTWVRKVATDV